MTKIFSTRLLAAALAASAALWAAPAAAEPPDWAPAHGHHKHKHKHRHDHDDTVVYVPYAVQPRVAYARAPYGIDRGTCDRGLLSSQTVGNVLGGVAGGVAGSQFGKGKGNTAATIGGTIVGVIIGGAVGESMDRVDSSCFAQALNHAPDRRRIAWANEQSGMDFGVTPMRSWQTGGSYCREYQTVAVVGGRRQQAYGTACRMPDGSWQIQN